MAGDGEQKRVLVLGAGLVTGPLVAYLAKRCQYKVLVASRTLARAEGLCKGLENASARELDVEKEGAEAVLEELTLNADAVISMLPYLFHVKAALIAIRHKRHFLTTSYVSPAMQELDQAAKEAGIVMVNECGLDPGTDHMSAMRVIDSVRARGGHVESFLSICGGLPAPDCNNNPLGYKFSWAPRGVLLASRNQATFKRDGKEVTWGSDNIFSGEEVWNIEELGCELEVYPNRNSLPYIDIYGMQNEKLQTIMRGTFRNKGWSLSIRALIRLGFLSTDEKEVAGLSFAAVTRTLVSAAGGAADAPLRAATAAALELAEDHYVLDNMAWLGLFDEEKKVPAGVNTYLDTVSAAMQSNPAMQFAEGERDLVVMRHKYVAQFPDGKTEDITTTLIDYGIPNGDSSMARTVSYPVAIATRLLLEGKITTTGVLRPITPELYNPILDELEKEFNIVFKDVFTPRQ
eukprot:CAMPEP_0114619978 /NCGR_PEP_ID=MMETSP0168-20121206/8484_1 /TAXON_ID=95228 ORGANISM="Vannella sp., Strain DIVA3 517/6/12" /NCGR_SAMPLE_ID=MMETSP0168 /ASSEMBLY_ACC=CAM_ASM_000044 /LENGTH=460 /DNA_ID=CAMNT_0001831147 /DNA_START=43 /DNA_END=1425 /DNA_ORIENTATION=-